MHTFNTLIYLVIITVAEWNFNEIEFTTLVISYTVWYSTVHFPKCVNLNFSKIKECIHKKNGGNSYVLAFFWNTLYANTSWKLKITNSVCGIYTATHCVPTQQKARVIKNTSSRFFRFKNSASSYSHINCKYWLFSLKKLHSWCRHLL